MIHKFKMFEENIVMDINSGAIHEVDNLIYDVLDYYKSNSLVEIVDKLKNKYSKEEIEEGYGEIKELESANLLYTADIYEDDAVKNQIKKRAPVVKALCLHIAHDCNLKCKYCFACEGEYHGSRSLMTFEVGKKAIDFIIENSGSRRNLEIDFFGGEPLMNFGVVKEIVTYAREQEKIANKKFRFTLTTNGILLNEEIQSYVNENMHNVVLSIDGRKEVNDNMRKLLGNQGSYDIIVPKFKKLAESRNQENYYVRGTFTSENLDFSNDVLHLADLGFKQISVEPVVAAKEAPYALTEEHIETLFKEYETLAETMLKRDDFNFFHFNIDLTGGPCLAKRVTGCGAGSEYLAVTPTGELYPCHQFVGDEDFLMGSVFSGVTNVDRRQEFECCNVYSKNECKTCFAKFYCSGGCAANAYQFGGDINSTYEIGCELQKKRIECAIFLNVKKK